MWRCISTLSGELSPNNLRRDTGLVGLVWPAGVDEQTTQKKVVKQYLIMSFIVSRVLSIAAKLWYEFYSLSEGKTSLSGLSPPDNDFIVSSVWVSTWLKFRNCCRKVL